MQKHNEWVDKVKDEWAAQHGIPLIRIWEHDINNNPSEVMKMLKRRLGEVKEKQDKKNEKEEKSLQTGKDADKFPLDDDLLDDVAGGRKSAVSPQIKDPFANPGLTN
jgi:hypothetical protein